MSRIQLSTLCLAASLEFSASVSMAQVAIPEIIDKPIWTAPAEGQVNKSPSGVFVLDAARLPAGFAMLVGRDDGLFLATAEGELTPKYVGPLQLKNLYDKVAVAKDGAYYLGGSGTVFQTIGGTTKSDAYVARLNSASVPQWERVLVGSSHRKIDDLAVTPNGDVVVAGTLAGSTWIARFSSGGEMIWERSVGVADSAAIAVVGNSLFVVAKEANDGIAAAYREDVSLWRFDLSGNLDFQKTIRQGLNSSRNSRFAFFEIVASEQQLFILSGWQDFTAAEALEITRVDLDGTVRWTHEVSGAVVKSTSGIYALCRPAMYSLQSGGAVVVCSYPDRISLSGYDTSKSPSFAKLIHPPACQNGAPASVFLNSESSGKVLLLVSPIHDVLRGTSCTWSSRVTLVNNAK